MKILKTALGMRLSTSLKTAMAETTILHGDARQERKTQIDRRGSRQHFDTDHMHVLTPMRSADWPVARSLQGQSARTETVTPVMRILS